MDKSDKQINKKPFTPQPPNRDNRLNYKKPQPVSTKAKNNEEINKTNIIDYKNISVNMTGEISSGFIHRNSLTQKQPNIIPIEDTEDDDEQFILNMKTIVDKNYKMQKENFSVRDLQSKSYLLRKKKCAFSDEDQNLIKRFKKSVDKSKAPQQSEQQVVSVSDHSCSITPQIPAVIKYNNMNFRGNTNELLFQVSSKAQKNDQWTTPKKAKTVTEIEIEQITYHEMQYFTPPQKNDL